MRSRLMLPFPVVANSRVLIIEPDEWDAALLAKFLSSAGYDVHVEREARAGFDKVRELLPDCILCNVNLPDIDGFWVARRVRSEPGSVALTPFLFLTAADDAEGRLQGLNVGADFHLSKPFHSEEVVAQVGALIEMAKRLRSLPPQRDEEPLSSTAGAAFHGDLAQMSLAAVLTLLELERRTGHLKVRSESGGVAMIQIVEGQYASGTLDGETRTGTDLLRELLRWNQGTFAFRTESVDVGSGEHSRLGSLVIEAMRLEDEAKR